MAAAPTTVVWDPLVRLLHWALVATFIVAYLSPAGRSVVHETAGYSVALIVVARIVWGFTGSVHARLRSFVVGPAKLGAYLWALVTRKEPRFLGHNPAGAAMILLLWALLAVICVSGWLLTCSRSATIGCYRIGTARCRM